MTARLTLGVACQDIKAGQRVCCEPETGRVYVDGDDLDPTPLYLQRVLWAAVKVTKATRAYSDLFINNPLTIEWRKRIDRAATERDDAIEDLAARVGDLAALGGSELAVLALTLEP